MGNGGHLVHNSCIDYEDIDDIVSQASKKFGKEIEFEYSSYEKARNIAFKLVGTIKGTKALKYALKVTDGTESDFKKIIDNLNK